MVIKRIQHVLVMMVALFVLGASSQAAVCELACGLQVHEAGCHAGMGSAMAGSVMNSMNSPAAMGHSAVNHAASAGMPHAHCSHMTMPVQAVVHSIGSCPEQSCSHTAVSAMDKGGVSSVSFAAVQWVTVASVSTDMTLPASYVGLGKRPPLALAGVDPLVVSLRV
ncbi:MAG: hypothetical protein JWM43_2930 [Acidobacteriaceae bacterium]|nr:hypothetical protein [Acidobacteriaceae bacterium]